MSDWLPVARLYVGGSVFDNEKILVGLSFTSGRTNVDDQAPAGYIVADLLDVGGVGMGITLNQIIKLTIEDSLGDEITLFTGKVSDSNSRLIEHSPGSSIISITKIIAVGTLARLNRATANANGYPEQDDADRVFAIIQDALATTWLGYNSTTSWDEVDPAITWANLEDSWKGTFDTSGAYDLAALAAGETNAYGLAVEAAKDGMGQLFESGDGKLNYWQASHRYTQSLIGYLNLTASMILKDNLQSSSSLADLKNVVTVKLEDGTSVTTQDQESIDDHGFLFAEYQTKLADLTQASARADHILSLYRDPRSSLSSISIAMSTPNMTDLAIDGLLAIYMGTPIAIAGLPSSLGGDFRGFIEGFTFTLTRSQLFANLIVSDFALSIATQRWIDTLSTLTWNTVSPSLTWQEATIIT